MIVRAVAVGNAGAFDGPRTRGWIVVNEIRHAVLPEAGEIGDGRLRMQARRPQRRRRDAQKPSHDPHRIPPLAQRPIYRSAGPRSLPMLVVRL